jgi:hypothetical protein
MPKCRGSRLIDANGQMFLHNPGAITMIAGAIGIRIFQKIFNPSVGLRSSKIISETDIASSRICIKVQIGDILTLADLVLTRRLEDLALMLLLEDLVLTPLLEDLALMLLLEDLVLTPLLEDLVLMLLLEDLVLTPLLEDLALMLLLEDLVLTPLLEDLALMLLL